MFCENCGDKIKDDYKFCTKCGNSISGDEVKKIYTKEVEHSEKWWYRLFKVVYIILNLSIIGIVVSVWSENLPYCFGQNCYGTYWDTIGASLGALLVSIIILRLLKLTFSYVVFGRKPAWRKEFKTPF